MKEEVKIEFASTDDIDAMISLVRDSFNMAYLESSIYRCKGITDFISTELNNRYSPYVYFVAKINETVVGFAEFKLFTETSTAFLNMIATNNVYKGKGIAKKIFHYCNAYFKQEKYSSIQLDVFNSNNIARDWYVNMGFVKEKTTYLYRQYITSSLVEDHHMMLVNVSQFKCLYEQFGFSFLQISMDNETYTIGAIDENLIIRGKTIAASRIATIQLFLNTYNFKKVFYKGDLVSFEDHEMLDEIHRMKLII